MNIAGVLNNIGPSQKAFYMIKELNELAKDPDNSCAAFIELMGVCVIKPFFSCYNIAFFSEYHGTAIATTLEEANIILQTSNNTNKYLYLWNLEWLNKPINYTAALDILLNPELKLIARSDSHAKVIENFCNKTPAGIVEDWNRHQLKEIVGS